ncbi:reverse transcriptase domain-containing protein [Tanacetum coccineum]
MNANTASTSGSGSFPSNTVANLRSDLKAITTRSGVSYDGPQVPPPPSSLPKVVEYKPEVTKDTVQPSTKNIQPLEKLHEKDDLLALKFMEMFRNLHFELSFTDALLHMPKFAPMFKKLLNNKDKIIDLIKTPVNENCSTVILKKFPKKLGDPAFKVGDTKTFSYNTIESVNRVDVIDVACEEYAQEVLGFLNISKSGNPTPTLEPILSTSPPSLTPFEGARGLAPSIMYPRKVLNDATREDHFPLSFMDQMLERLTGNEYYSFLDGFLGYFQIPIDPKDKEKTTFTCPYETFAYRRMPFGLCNALGTFQRCMMAIFHDMIEEIMEVFMDDFSVFGDSFSSCLSHLDKMLKRCKDTNLVLNREKCHFMVKEGIVLGHKISKSEIEVDRAKVDVIAKLPHLITVKGVRKAFNALKKKLTEAPILVAPDWDLSFEIMCDASNFAVGAENLPADHLSRLENPHQSELEKKEIMETFPIETLGMVTFRGDASTP